jgi:hypothetical protein
MSKKNEVLPVPHPGETLQEEYDLRKAERQLASRIAREVRPCPLLETAATA